MRADLGCIIVAAVEGHGVPPAVRLQRALNEQGVRSLIFPIASEGAIVTAAERAAAIVIKPNRSDVLPAERIIAAIRRSQPHVPIFFLLDLREGIGSRIHRLARAGADDVFLMKSDDSTRDVARCVARYTKHLIPRELALQLNSTLPEDVRDFVSWGLRRGWKPVKAEDFADYFDKNRKTIYVWLTRLGLPSISIVVRLCRLAHVCIELDATEATESAIARHLQFGSDGQIRMIIRRELHSSVTSIRGAAVETFRAAWRARFQTATAGADNEASH